MKYCHRCHEILDYRGPDDWQCSGCGLQAADCIVYSMRTCKHCGAEHNCLPKRVPIPGRA
jgi:hypothetical protein